MRMSLQYSLVNQVLYAMDATITAKSLEYTHTDTYIRGKIQIINLANSICSKPFDVIDP